MQMESTMTRVKGQTAATKDTAGPSVKGLDVLSQYSKMNGVTHHWTTHKVSIT